jgi:hypothetical protein
MPPRGGRARDFVNFRKKISCIARARRAPAGLTVYPPWIQIAELALCHDEVRILIFDDAAEH